MNTHPLVHFARSLAKLKKPTNCTKNRTPPPPQARSNLKSVLAENSMQIIRKYSEVLAKSGHMVASSIPGRPSTKSVDSREFHTIRRLGKGESGIVYETKWNKRGSRYARKVFLETNNAAFEHEAARVVPLEHSNLVRHFCSFFDNRSCSLIMEIMQDDLHTLVHKRKDERWIKMTNTSSSPSSSSAHAISNSDRWTSEMNQQTRANMSGLEIEITKPKVTKEEECNSFFGPFELCEAIDLMLQIAKGVKYLHENKVAHGDLKPDNILVNVDHPTPGRYSGDRMTAKVADFGMIGTKVWRMLRSCDTLHIGMVRWRAPEVFKLLPGYSANADYYDPYKPLVQEYHKPDTGNARGYAADSSEDPILPEIFTNFSKLEKADVWSFGMTCAEILTGEMPYSKCTLSDLQTRISSGNRPELPPTCPITLEGLLLECWDLDPKHRPTFSEICERLETLKLQVLTTGSKTSEDVNESEPPPHERSDHSDEDKKSFSIGKKAKTSVSHFGNQMKQAYTGSCALEHLRKQKVLTEHWSLRNWIMCR